MRPGPHPRTLLRRHILWLATGLIFAPFLHAATVEEAQALFLGGNYTGAATAAAGGAHDQPEEATWPLLQAEALNAVGRYQEARAVLDPAIEHSPNSLQLRLESYKTLRALGAVDDAAKQLAELDRLGGARAWAYRSPEDRVALARAALLVGTDPKKVLDQILDPLRKSQPDFRDTYLVSGELALSKNDFALAARIFGTGVKKFGEDPDFWFGLARAFASSDPEAAQNALEQTLKFNPNHLAAQLLIADELIDGENYDDAAQALTKALAINPHLAEAHAYRAVLAHLRADPKTEAVERTEALQLWSTNPAVPHLIGHKLSQKYRFAEGVALQREALKWDPNYLPAKSQLANDLLRLGGHDDEAWQLADEVQKADPYDVVAYNLTELHDAIAHFETLSSAHFNVKMDPREAGIYGPKVVSLLERAHETLTKKYGLTLHDKTIVEIFPDQKDFAIRTFGLPGGAGYLGVCFGRVITANSPASRPNSPNSWEAVLWHEFCHVVTLTLTENKMPRWLSEGISVYEERQARGNWGEQMKPRYRAMILGEDLTPMSQLSAAFLKPKSPAHLGFAYYESSLVVEWLVEHWGLEKVKALLADLARGVEINAALAAHFAPIEQLDADFAAHAVEIAKNTGPKLDWTPPGAADFASAKRLNDFIAKNPDNFTALTERAKELIEAKKWTEAKAPLQKLIELYPNQHDAGSAYATLAHVHRMLKESEAEIAMLNKLVELNSDAVDAFERLMQIAAERKDWPGVLANADRFAAVNPLSPIPHRFAADAHEALGEKPGAISDYRTLLQLGPSDPAEIHYRLAHLLHSIGDVAAKREVILALEDAPRFRAALQLLLEIDEPAGKPAPGSTTDDAK
ncbi:MAG: tetratricopeptide repeat protein [Chthoniobacter sp.]|uniref:tetratricopeptide repeat protein n=1 Tax=Chthoniobacter sp. TaxID=2510640 RepID=UPI0032A8DD95